MKTGFPRTNKIGNNPGLKKRVVKDQFTALDRLVGKLRLIERFNKGAKLSALGRVLADKIFDSPDREDLAGALAQKVLDIEGARGSKEGVILSPKDEIFRATLKALYYRMGRRKFFKMSGTLGAAAIASSAPLPVRIFLGEEINRDGSLRKYNSAEVIRMMYANFKQYLHHSYGMFGFPPSPPEETNEYIRHKMKAFPFVVRDFMARGLIRSGLTKTEVFFLTPKGVRKLEEARGELDEIEGRFMADLIEMVGRPNRRDKLQESRAEALASKVAALYNILNQAYPYLETEWWLGLYVSAQKKLDTIDEKIASADKSLEPEVIEKETKTIIERSRLTDEGIKAAWDKLRRFGIPTYDER